MKKKKLLEIQKFVHCHFHSEFSFLDSIITVKGLGKILRNKGFTACAITDHGNVNGVYRFVKDLKEAGVKPIVGVEAYYVEDRHRRGLTDEEKEEAIAGLEKSETRVALKQAEKDSKVRKSNHIILLAKNHKGWSKIIRAIELAHKEGFYYRPRIDFELLKTLAPDVIVTSACITGVASSFIREDKVDKAFDWCKKVKDIFGDDFYIEIQPLDLEDQINLNPVLVDIADTLEIKLVATNDCHYIEGDDWVTHDVLLALRDSQHGKRVLVSDEDRFRYNTRVLSVKSRNEMQNAFAIWHPEIPEDVWMKALDNTLEIVDKCEDEILKFRKGVLPVVEVEDEYDNDPDKKLWALVNKGWKWREIQTKSKGKAGTIDWIDGQDPKRKPLYHVYKERVKYEMQEITRLGFSKYFLVIYDLIWWCRDEGIRPGPGRGSVAGSLVAYLLGITAVDSIKWDCPFSRFISPDRIDYPDIDMDFPTVERRKVKEYIVEKYGQDQVASICNYSTMKGKMVLKDVARVHGVPYGETEAVAGHIITRASGDARGSACLEDTFREFAECRSYYKRYPEVVKHAMKLEGNVRQLGVNAAGMVVSDSPLREIAPVQYQRTRDSKGGVEGEYLVGWDKREIEEVGLLKLDVLGIEGLTYIQRCIDLIEERHDIYTEPEEWEDLDDPEVFEQFQEGNTELVWQMNTQGAIRTLKKLKPDKFEHLMAVTSLIRPGPLYAGITADYIKRRHGEEVKSVHPQLDKILGKTYGLCIYQEGATQIVHDLAGFTWAEADAVRKCISKKMGKEYMQQHKQLFFKGTKERGVDEVTAEKIWDSIGQFGQYAFNKAHATAYSLLSYWTMWFKVKYPLEFMCAALQSDSNPDKRRLYIKEAIRLGLNIASPDVNISGEGFTIDDKQANTIRCGFSDIRGVGEKTVQKITAGVPYTSLKDFLVRCRVNKTVVSVMLQTGALDSICENPCVAWDNLERIIKVRKKKNENTQDKYWEEEVVPYFSKKFVTTIAGARDKFTEKEREIFRIQFLSLPPEIHPAVPVRIWLQKNCKHIKFHEIRKFPDLFDVEFDTENKAFVGVCTRVQFQNIATQLSPEERAKLKEELGAFADKMEGTERRVKLNLEDDTDFLMGMSSPEQYTAMDENKVKEGMVFLAIGSGFGDFRIKASLFVNMTDMLERIKNEEKFDPGTQEYFLLNDPFKNWRSDIKKDKMLKPLNKKAGEFRSAVHVIDIQDIITKKKKKMGKVTCVDWLGNMKDITLWGDEYGMYRDRIEIGKTFVTFVYCKKQGNGYRYSLSLRSSSMGIRIKEIEDYF